MPTYEYVCEACGHAWDAFQSIKEDALKTCPACEKDQARRVISGGMGFILKGGGWYSDLYASPKADASKSKSEGDSSSSTKSEASGGESKSSEKKADKKAETKPAKAKE